VIKAILGVLTGFVSGAMAGAFGVGGAILTTPAVQVLLGAPAYIAVGTPLPVILPTTVSGAQAYRRAGQIDWRAVRWAAPPGAIAAAAGAYVTQFIDPRGLLLATAVLIGWQAYRVGTGRSTPQGTERSTPPPTAALAAAGLAATCALVAARAGCAGSSAWVTKTSFKRSRSRRA
jgi:uncharacterized membrane protein YfcA